MKRFLFNRYDRLRCWLIPGIKALVFGIRRVPYKEVPIVINNYNRLTSLKKLVEGLEVRGYTNIHIIDNASTYTPLLEYYAGIRYPVYFLHKNVGHLAVWETGLYKMFTDSYFAYTDSDLEIFEDCPDDFMEKFIKLLKKHPTALKAGFSLKIDDIPDSYSNKRSVIDWESQFWKKKIDGGFAYKAPIDTTFAVYKPYFIGHFIRLRDFKKCYIRTAPPYCVRHLPWYVDSANLSEEEAYYSAHLRTVTHWSGKAANP